MFLKSIINFIKSDSLPKMFFKYYLSIIFVGGLLLWLPISLNNGIEVDLIDSIFAATSAVSVTGLATVNTLETFNTFGHVVIMILIICGGMGVMVIKAAIYLLFRMKIDKRDRQMIMSEQQQFSMAGMARLVKQIIIITIIITTIGWLLVATRLYTTYDYSLKESLWYGLFHSISSINNAGFDLFGDSFIGFKDDYYIQTIFMLLIIFGGIGFPVIIELSRFVKTKLKNRKVHFQVSLFTKLTVSTYFVILGLGFIFIFLIEYNTGLAYDDNTFFDKVYLALFQSVTTRNAGFATTDLARFSNPTIFIMTVMMFIGAAPSSTGGGIRTTTFAVIIVYAYSKALNRKNVTAFKRRLPSETTANAYFTFTLGVLILFFGTTAILVIENLPTTAVLFEVSSAFGTTGLSTGITANLQPASKIIIIIIMFIGQIGIATMLGVWHQEKKDDKGYSYAEENVLIG